jgi:RHS repeat-associated protein
VRSQYENKLKTTATRPFGELNSTDSGISTHKFTGDERDAETSFDHTQFRQYTSQLARWITPDPAGLVAVDPGNPQSWNRYSYVLNNPLALIDPWGLGPQDCENGVPVSPDGLNSCGDPCLNDPFECVSVSAPAPPIFPTTDVPLPNQLPGGGGGHGGGGGPSLWTVSKNLNSCAAQLSQTKSLSALTKNTKLPIPEFLGSNFFGDVFSLATGSGGLDQGAGIAAEGTIQIAEHAGAQVAIGTLTTISKPVSATAGVYNPVAVGTASQSFGGTIGGRFLLGFLKAASVAKVGWDAAMYLAAEAACAAPAWTQ